MVLVESAPTIFGSRVILRAPRESDKADRLSCPRSAEAVRMYGGDFRELKPVTVEESSSGTNGMPPTHSAGWWRSKGGASATPASPS